jgi:pyruvate formate lyase activating enzyme
MSAQELASKVDEHTSCICFFGGDPSTQMPHALKTSKLALKEASEENRKLRVCWESNGLMLTNYANQAAKLALESGGNVKFDLKAWDENLSIALCGSSNRAAFKNFREIGDRICSRRPEPPVLTASTLLVPGYIDHHEVKHIARFIAEIDRTIPYTLLAFYPAYKLRDLPITSRAQAQECYDAAKRFLQNVRIGNEHLLRGH